LGDIADWACSRPLPEIHEDLRLGLLIEAELPDILHDADHLPWFRVASKVRRRAHRIFAWEIAASKRLIDDQDARLAGAIMLIKVAAGLELNLKNFEIFVADQSSIFR
jgi:hypothetical protein